MNNGAQADEFSPAGKAGAIKWLETLQENYRSGNWTREQYEYRLKVLLMAGDLDCEEHEAALKFNPRHLEESLASHSSQDMQRMAYHVARRLLRQQLNQAGVNLDVGNKALIAAVVELAQAGLKARELALELEVWKTSDKFHPIQPAQIVRALEQNAAQLRLDASTGLPTSESVREAISKLAIEEPNLFAVASPIDP